MALLAVGLGCTPPRSNEDRLRDASGAALDGDPACDGGELVACREDGDGDGWGAGPSVEGCAPCPEGWAPDTGGRVDCFDGDERVWPGQLQFFAEPYDRDGVPSFDYDCDGRETPLRSEIFVGGLPCASCRIGWVDPVCGERAVYRTCQERVDQPCPGDVHRTVRCR
ncbi:MAG: hypothetical protein KF729_00435 [Sandaracinaceae bacterium]|nr:hypothetical protein [Sandaracinaceae bacterium]